MWGCVLGVGVLEQSSHWPGEMSLQADPCYDLNPGACSPHYLLLESGGHLGTFPERNESEQGLEE